LESIEVFVRGIGGNTPVVLVVPQSVGALSTL
jgi:hypothetical protein